MWLDKGYPVFHINDTKTKVNVFFPVCVQCNKIKAMQYALLKIPNLYIRGVKVKCYKLMGKSSLIPRRQSYNEMATNSVIVHTRKEVQLKTKQ